MQPNDFHPSETGAPPPEAGAHNPSHVHPLHEHWPAPPPIQPHPPAALPVPASDTPVPVVKVLSVRGVEYAMMTIALWVVASTLAWIFLNVLNGSSSFDYIVVPTSALIVCAPVFGLLFIRLKRGELANPALRLDPSKRRWSQSTQLLAYIACLINMIYFVYVVLQHTGGKSSTSITKAAINLVVILAIAGGVLAYYWFDEHRPRKT